MKKRTLYVIWILIGVSMLFQSCGSKEQEKSKQKQEWEQRVKDLKTTLINRYNPIEYPPQDFSKRKVFTYNLQKILVNGNRRPVLFDGFLDDITEDRGQFFVHFICRLSEDFLEQRTIWFHLKCKYEQVKFVTDSPPEYDLILSDFLFLSGQQRDFLVVCVVTDVKKIVNFTVRGYSSEESEDVELEIESPDTFSVIGELLEMVKYPETPK